MKWAAAGAAVVGVFVGGTALVAQADVLGKQNHHVAAWTLGVFGILCCSAAVVFALILAVEAES